jgi:hypothetical protein
MTVELIPKPKFYFLEGLMCYVQAHMTVPPQAPRELSSHPFSTWVGSGFYEMAVRGILKASVEWSSIGTKCEM